MTHSKAPEDCFWLLAKGMSQVTDTLIKNWTKGLPAWILHRTPDGNCLLTHYWPRLSSNYCSMARKQPMPSLLLLSQQSYALALNNFQVILEGQSLHKINLGVVTKKTMIRLMCTTFAQRIFQIWVPTWDFLKENILNLKSSFKIFSEIFSYKNEDVVQVYSLCILLSLSSMKSLVYLPVHFP